MTSIPNDRGLFLRVVKHISYTYATNFLNSMVGGTPSSYVKVTKGVCCFTSKTYMIISAAYIYAPLVDIFDLNFSIAVPLEPHAPLKENFYIGYVSKESLNDYLISILRGGSGCLHINRTVPTPVQPAAREFNGLKVGCWKIAGDLLDSCEYDYVQAFYKFDYRSLPFQWFADSRHEHNLIKYAQQY